MKPNLSTRLKSVNVLTGLWAFGILLVQFFLILPFQFAFLMGFIDGTETAVSEIILEEQVKSIELALTSGSDPVVLDEQLNATYSDESLLVRVYDESQTAVIKVGSLDAETEAKLSSVETRSQGDLKIDGWDQRTDNSYQNPAGRTYTVIVSCKCSENLNVELDEFRLFAIILLSLAVAVPLAALNGFISAGVVQLVLGKVRKIQREVNTISLGSLDRRVPTSGSTDAIDQLAVTMNNMLERLQKSNNQQTQFMADVSHELRSPITGMLSQLEVAEHYPENIDIDRMLPQLISESRRAKNVIDDLMFLSRLEAEGNGKAPLSVEPVSVDALAKSEVATMQKLHPNIELTLLAPQPTVIRAETNKFARVLRNLLTNACRHAYGNVALEVRQNNGYMTLDIRDDGDGIAEADRERIFDRFVRLDQARTRDTGGSGLGLAMTREIVESCGGQVWALAPEHPDLRGAHFRVSMPLWVENHPSPAPPN